MRRGLLLFTSALGLLSQTSVSAETGFSVTADNVGWEIRTTPSESKVEVTKNSKIASWTAAGTGGVRLAQSEESVRPILSDHALNFKNGSVFRVDTPISLSAPGETRFSIAIAFSAAALKNKQTIFDSGNGVKVQVEPASLTDPNIGRISLTLPNNEVQVVETCVGRMSLFMFSIFVEDIGNGQTELKAAIYKNGKVLGSKGLPINDFSVAQDVTEVTVGCDAEGASASSCFNGKIALVYILKENVDAKTAYSYFDVFKKNQLSAVFGAEQCGNNSLEGEEECDGGAGCSCACYQSCTPLDATKLASTKKWKFPNGANDFYSGAEVEITCSDDTVAVPGFDATGKAVCQKGAFKLPLVKCEKPCGNLSTYLKTHYSTRGVLPLDETSHSVEDKSTAGTHIACADGYMSTDGRTTEILTCANGAWSDVTLDCRESCPVFQADRHPASYKLSATAGHAADGEFKHGEQLTITCAPGSSSTSSEVSAETLTCIKGAWTKNTLTCEPNCPTFPALGHGYKFASKEVKSASNQAGSIIGVQCDSAAGYYPTQSNIPVDYVDNITCSNGVWSAQTLLCKKGCEEYFIEGNFTNLEAPVLHPDPYTGKNDRLPDGSIPYGRSITLTCQDGFAASNGLRDETITCTGSWPERSLKCEPICSSNPVLPAGLIFSAASKASTEVEQGAVRTVLCEENTSSLSGRTEEHLFCLNGQWTVPTLTCLQNCPADVLNGREFDPERYEIVEDLGADQFASFIRKGFHSRAMPAHDMKGHHRATMFVQTHQATNTTKATTTKEIEALVEAKGAVDSDGTSATIEVDGQLVNRSVFSIGARRMLKCREGYADPRDGRTFEYVTCVDSKWTVPTLVCEQTCEPFPELSSAYNVYSDGNTFHGSSRTVSCATGTKNSSKNGIVSEIVKCSYGVWGALSLECHADCPESAIPSYISVITGKGLTGHGTLRELECLEQQGQDGSIKVSTTCVDGAWTPFELNCNGDCPAYHDATGKYVIESSCTTTGCDLNLNCDPTRFDTVKQGVQTCGKDGTWTGTLPECKAKCGAFPVLGPAYVTTEIASGVVQVTCSKGYVQDPVGNDGILSTCSDGGSSPGVWKFSLDSIKCLPTCAPFKPADNEYIFQYENKTQYVNGDSITVACAGDIGSDAITSNVTCISGVWTESNLACRKTCNIFNGSAALQQIVVGGVFADGYTYAGEGSIPSILTGVSKDGDSALISCAPGYTALAGNGIQEVRCTDGILTTPALKCEAACPAKSPLQCNAGESCKYITKGSDIAPGSSRQVWCADGFYSTTGESIEEIFCEDGSWTNPSLNCIKRCGALVPVEGANTVAAAVVADELTGVQRVTISCKPGYSSPLGSNNSEETLTCSHGAWPTQGLYCTPNCQTLPALNPEWNLEIYQAPPGVNSYDEAVVACKGKSADDNTSFKPVTGSSSEADEYETLTCRNGKWSTPSLRCTDSCLDSDLTKVLTAHIATRPGLVMPAVNIHSHLTAEVYCPEGTLPVRGASPESLVCQNGDWSHIALECAPLCPALKGVDAEAFAAAFAGVSGGLPEAYTVLEGAESDVAHGASARIACAEGNYPAEGSVEETEVITCVRGSWTKAALHCAPQCPEFRDNSLVVAGTADKKRRHGASRVLSCAAGTTAVQGVEGQTVVCENGRWSGRTLECKAACDMSNLANSSITESCPIGTSSVTGVNTETRTCVDGQYTPSVLDCKKDCPAFDAALHAPGYIVPASISNIATTNGALATIGCPAGTVGAKGQTKEDLVCWDGQWAAPTLTCTATCSELPVYEEGIVVNSNSNGQSALITCATGFVALPLDSAKPLDAADEVGSVSLKNSSVSCNAGVWPAAPIRCVRGVIGSPAEDFTKVWVPQGTQPQELKGRLDAEFTVLRPAVKKVGNKDGSVTTYYPTSDYLLPSGSTAMPAEKITLVTGYLETPASYEKIWTSEVKAASKDIQALENFANGRPAANDEMTVVFKQIEQLGGVLPYVQKNGVRVSIWRPIPKDGFKCLGSVVTEGTDAPALDAIRCVAKTCVEKSTDEASLGTNSSGFSAWTHGNGLFTVSLSPETKYTPYTITTNCLNPEQKA